jgi:uncharacterized protein (DUF362 family)
MPETTVTVTYCPNYNRPEISTAIERQFTLLGGIGKFICRGDSVLLKPNLIVPRPAKYAAQTDPAVIIETARLIKDFGAKPFIGDSPAWGNVFTCIKALELDEPLRKLDVPVRQLDCRRICRIGNNGTAIGISSVALDADAIINLPKFKSHQQLVATFAVKNMFGCVSGKHKAVWHLRKGHNIPDFCQMLIDIYAYLKPVLTIIDGVIAMDGPGPIRGRARPLGWLIGGVDPVAVEIICAGLTGLEPDDVPIIKAAKQAGFGCTNPDEIKILGDDFSGRICRDFQPAHQIPLRFSLPHVCKSIGKQIVFLTKSRIERIRSKK